MSGLRPARGFSVVRRARPAKTPPSAESTCASARRLALEGASGSAPSARARRPPSRRRPSARTRPRAPRRSPARRPRRRGSASTAARPPPSDDAVGTLWIEIDVAGGWNSPLAAARRAARGAYYQNGAVARRRAAASPSSSSPKARRRRAPAPSARVSERRAAAAADARVLAAASADDAAADAGRRRRRRRRRRCGRQRASRAMSRASADAVADGTSNAWKTHPRRGDGNLQERDARQTWRGALFLASTSLRCAARRPRYHLFARAARATWLAASVGAPRRSSSSSSTTTTRLGSNGATAVVVVVNSAVHRGAPACAVSSLTILGSDGVLDASACPTRSTAHV